MKKIFPIVMMAGMLLAACGSDDDFAAGPASQIKGEGVYFLSYDAQNIIGDEPTIEDTLWFELGRTDTTTAIDVPIITESKDDIIKVPSSVHFDKGDSTAYLGLTYVGLRYLQDSRFVLRIGDDYANPYAEKDGSTRLASSVFRSRWVEVCDTLIMVSQSGNLPDQGCDLERLEGMNRLRITNFMGSGHSLEFSFTTGYNKDDITKSKGEINPMSNYYDFNSQYWYFTNGGNYDAWSPTGCNKVINFMEFYKGDSYTYLDLQCDKATSEKFKWGGKTYYCDYLNHSSCMAAWINYLGSDATLTGWDYLYFYPGYLVEN